MPLENCTSLFGIASTNIQILTQIQLNLKKNSFFLNLHKDLFSVSLSDLWRELGDTAAYPCAIIAAAHLPEPARHRSGHLQS